MIKSWDFPSDPNLPRNYTPRAAVPFFQLKFPYNLVRAHIFLPARNSMSDESYCLGRSYISRYPSWFPQPSASYTSGSERKVASPANGSKSSRKPILTTRSLSTPSQSLKGRWKTKSRNSSTPKRDPPLKRNPPRRRRRISGGCRVPGNRKGNTLASALAGKSARRSLLLKSLRTRAGRAAPWTIRRPKGVSGRFSRTTLVPRPPPPSPPPPLTRAPRRHPWQRQIRSAGGGRINGVLTRSQIQKWIPQSFLTCRGR